MAESSPSNSGRQSQPVHSGSEGSSPVSENLLNEIRERIERLEENLAIREQRLTHQEQQLQAKAGKFQNMQAELARQRSELDQQVAELLQKQKQLTTQVQRLTAERDTAMNELSQTKSPFTSPAPETSAEPPATQAPAKTGWAISEPGSGGSVFSLARGLFDRFPMRWRLCLTAAFAGLLTLSLILAIVAWKREAREYLAWTAVIVPVHDTTRLQESADIAHTLTESVDGQSIAIEQDTVAGTLNLSIRTKNPSLGENQLGRVGKAILDQLQAVVVSTSMPTSAPAASEAESLEQTIHEIERQIAGHVASQPADAESSVPATAEASARLQQRQKLTEQWERISREWDALRQQPAGAVVVDAERLRAAEQSNTRLQADADALTHRQKQLAEQLNQRIAAACDAMGKLPPAIAAAEPTVTDATKGNYEEPTKKELESLQKLLETWKTQGTELRALLESKRAGLNDTGSDFLPVFDSIETMSRNNLDDRANSLASAQQILESIGSSDSNPTKGVVLQSALTKSLQPAFEARQAVEAALAGLVRERNVELADILQRTAAIRKQVMEQREQLAAVLSRQLAQEQQTLREKQLADLQTQRNQLLEQLQQLDRQIASDAQALIERTRDEWDHQKRWRELLDLQQQRALHLARLADLQKNAIENQQPTPAPVSIRVLPVRVSPLPIPTAPRLTRAIMLAMFPWLLAISGYLIWRMVTSYRRNRRILREYQNELTASRSSHQ